MPSQSEHKKKYDENKSLLENELSIEHCMSFNWITTIAFYAALHLVEGKLAEYDIHSKSHTARENMVNMQREFKNIRSKYKYLHTKSIVARYAGESITKTKAEDALKYLSDIEKEIIL